MLGHEFCAVIVATGLEGTLLVLAFGQILPQLVGSRYPTNHFSLPGCEQLVYLSLFLEKTGVVQLSWAAAAGARSVCGLVSEPYGFGGEVGQTEGDGKSEVRALMTDDAISNADSTAEGGGGDSERSGWVVRGECGSSEVRGECVDLGGVGLLQHAAHVLPRLAHHREGSGWERVDPLCPILPPAADHGPSRRSHAERTSAGEDATGGRWWWRLTFTSCDA